MIKTEENADENEENAKGKATKTFLLPSFLTLTSFSIRVYFAT